MNDHVLYSSFGLEYYSTVRVKYWIQTLFRIQFKSSLFDYEYNIAISKHSYLADKLSQALVTRPQAKQIN